MLRQAVVMGALLLAACSGKKKAPDPEPAAPPAPPSPGTAAATNAQPPGPAAPKGTELPGLGATIVLPAGATVEMTEARNQADDGFSYATPVARITGAAPPGIIEVSTGAELGWVPTTLVADLADVARQGHEKITSGERDGTWAAAYKLTDSCYVRSWSPAAKVWCEVSAPGLVGMPCDRVQGAVDVCLTLAAAGTATAPRLDVKEQFASVKDARALDAIVAAGRAVALDDRAAFTALLAPGTFQLGKKKLDAAALAAAVDKAGSLSKLLGNDCAPTPDGARNCTWNTEADGADGKLAVYSHTGYGVVPTLELARQPDGAWRVTGFGSVDLGEP